MQIAKLLLSRLLWSLLVLAGLSMLIFTIARIMPGDPARMALGPRAPEWALERYREEASLNEPIHIQYAQWIKNALHGDLGTSLVTHRDVFIDIKEFFPATLELVVCAALFSGIAGLGIGLLSGWKKNTWIDNVARVLGYLGVVTPSFVWAIFFVLLFSYVMPIFPTVGRLGSEIVSPPRLTGLFVLDALFTGNGKVLMDAIWHLILPAVSLGMSALAQGTRITRASVTDNLQKDYIAAARASALPERLVMFKYLLKPSLVAPISIHAMGTAVMFGNAFLVEVIFGWPGLSRYGMSAILNKDLNAIIGVIMVYGVMFVIANLVADIGILLLEPRLRLAGGKL